MDLKNAVSVCLISFFAATLVVLITRALDWQSASRLERQVERIADELEAIRKQGGIVIPSSSDRFAPTVKDPLMVYYFHGNVRCPTCRAIESQARQTLQASFAPLLENLHFLKKAVTYCAIEAYG